MVAFPYFALLNTGIAVVILLTMMVTQLQHSMEYGPQAALIAESFPTGLRYGGAGLGYQLASVIAGGPAPLIATWLLHDYGWQAISVFMIIGAVIGFAATLALPDRSRIDIPTPRPTALVERDPHSGAQAGVMQLQSSGLGLLRQLEK